MRQACTTVESRATTVADRLDSRRGTAGISGQVLGLTVQTDSDDDRWFSRAARALFPGKAGFTLHLETASDERSCHRYAAGERQPPLNFFRQLAHGERGRAWLFAFMEGCKASWWQDVKDGLELLDAFRATQASQRMRAGDQ